MKITKETNIKEAVKANPKAEEIFYEAGLGCAGCMFSEMESIEEGLMAHGMGEEDVEEILEELNKSTES